MQLAFRLLGDVAAVADGHPLDLGGTRQRSVFALLLLQRNRPVTSESLAERVWPDEQPLTAIKTIQVYISRIRQALDPDGARLASTPTGYRFDVADDELDVARFERGLRQARESVASGARESSLATLEAVLELWTGPALGDLAGEQFARREAERLEELRVQALEELLELRIGAGMVRQAIPELQRLVGDQPGRERLWRLLMHALYVEGRQGEALQAYQDARRYLADELGLDPGPELQELERAILTQSVPRSKPATGRGPGDAIPTDVDEADNLLAEPIAPRARRVVTVLRADVVRSSDAGERDPEILEATERGVQDIVRRAVERHGGTIDRADHSGVTAAFGLVVAREDDALRAARAALEVRDGSGEIGTTATITFGVGVATGEVLAGSGDRGRSTIVGTAVKTAAQLAARAGPREVLLALETEQLVRHMATTHRVSVRELNGAPVPSGVRLLALTDGDAIVRRRDTRFVGRASELAALLAAFEQVESTGTPGLVTVIGAPGVGKSRLVAESLTRLDDRARILRARCLPYGDGITYWPVRDLVLGALGIEPGETRDAGSARLGAIVAGMERGDAIRSRVASAIGLADDAAPGEEIPWAVRRFFEALAAQRPLVLLIDDLQWAESALLDLLEHVLDLGRGAMLLVAIGRPEIEESRPGWLARPSLLLTRLEALADADAATLLDQLAPELPLGPLRSRVLAAAEGNPLFVEQFVAYVADEPHTDGRTLTDRTPANLPIPPTIAALLAARLDHLGDVERRLLECAAVVGRTFWVGALAELLPDGERTGLPRRLANLSRRDLIRPDRASDPADEAYRFRHLLIRDAAYAALPKRDRADLHERFAGWLERRSAAHPGEFDLIRGYHLEQAYRYRVELVDNRSDTELLAARAVQLLAPAGKAALERGDAHAATTLLRRAVDLSGSRHQRIELLLDLRRALRTIGEREASDAADAEALALLAKDPDEGLEHRRRLTEAVFLGNVSVTDAQAAYAYFENAGDRLGMIRALEVAFNIHAVGGEITRALELHDQATALALEVGQADRTAGFSFDAAWALPDSPVPVSDALERCSRYLEMAGDHRESSAFVLLVIGQLEAMSGLRDRWRRRFDAAKAVIDDLGLVVPLGAAVYPMFLAETEMLAGEAGRSIDVLLSSCAILDRVGDPRLSSLAPRTAQALLALGRLDEVEHYAVWGRDRSDPRDLDAEAWWRMALSGLRSRQGGHEEAIDLARQSVALMASSEMVVTLGLAHMALAGALRLAGDEPAALASAREAQRLAVAKGNQAAMRTIGAFLHD